MIAFVAFVFCYLTGYLNFASASTHSTPPVADESCHESLDSVYATIDIANLAARLNRQGIGQEHRLVVDAGSDNSARTIKTSYRYAGTNNVPLEVSLWRPENRVGAADKAELDLRPRQTGPVELALKVWPKQVKVQDRNVHLEPLELHPDQSADLNQINRELERGQLSSFKDAVFSLRVVLSVAIPPELREFAQADRRANELLMGRQPALKIIEQLGFAQALKQLRQEFGGAAIEFEDIDYRQGYSATTFHLVLLPTFIIPPGLDRYDVHLAFYRILHTNLRRKFSTGPARPSLRSRLNSLRENLQERLQLAPPDDESIQFISVSAKEFTIPSLLGPLKLVFYKRNPVLELDLTQGPNQK